MYDQTPEIDSATAPVLWNKGKLIGQKPPLTLKQIWAIRIRLQMDRRPRDLALFNLAIDGKLRGCDLVDEPPKLLRQCIDETPAGVSFTYSRAGATENSALTCKDFLCNATRRKGSMGPAETRDAPHEVRGRHASTIGSGGGGASALSRRCRLTELGRFVGPGHPGWTLREPGRCTDRGADEPALENGHGEDSLAGIDPGDDQAVRDWGVQHGIVPECVRTRKVTLNLQVGARILATCYRERRDRWDAVGCYHAPNNQKFASGYRRNVAVHWQRITQRG